MRILRKDIIPPIKILKTLLGDVFSMEYEKMTAPTNRIIAVVMHGDGMVQAKAQFGGSVKGLLKDWM